MATFSGPRKKLSIGSLDESTLQVEAQYNPKELQIEKPVQWAKHDVLAHGRAADARRDAIASRGRMHLEFTGAEARTMAVELMFDGYETQQSVMPQIADLERMASVRDGTSGDEDFRRPHRCVVSWGDRGIPPFRCVIDGVSTKFLVFDSDGVPLRATCTIKLREADAVGTSADERDRYAGRRLKR
ncbi:MAG: hypothetical protein JWO36_936 [Myxococcales bacterium]|nr:hypothetical protein [Myxococcales bacterium]